MHYSCSSGDEVGHPLHYAEMNFFPRCHYTHRIFVWLSLFEEITHNQYYWKGAPLQRQFVMLLWMRLAAWGVLRLKKGDCQCFPLCSSVSELRATTGRAAAVPTADMESPFSTQRWIRSPGAFKWFPVTGEPQTIRVLKFHYEGYTWKPDSLADWLVLDF